jgi:ABC-type oligopeptide transport system ATPase subunit
MTDTPDLLEIRGLSKTFSQPRGLGDVMLGQPARALHAVRDVSFRLAPGDTLGVVGESGCGKSTLGLHRRAACAKPRRDILRLASSHTPARSRQMIFQDPYARSQSAHDGAPDPGGVLRPWAGDGAERQGRVESRWRRSGWRRG